MALDFSAIAENTSPLLAGLGTTIAISMISIVMGGLIGLLFSFVLSDRRSSGSRTALKGLIHTYVSMFRGTPLLTQLIIAFYVIPSAIGIDIPSELAAITALTLNTAAFQCEIFRGGLRAISVGQSEAATMLGIKRWQARRRILTPQLFRLVMPALTTEIIIILKNSSLISVIAVTDLMRSTQQIAAATFRPTEAYLIAAAGYLLLTVVASSIGSLVERRLARAAA